MPLGIVSFFNISRGFGKIRTDEVPEGVFVHYSEIQGEAKILIEHEMVEFELKPTQKGPQANGVIRLSERLKGKIIQYDKGYGYVKTREGKIYFLHHKDVIGMGFKRIEPFFEVEFSPFEGEDGALAKEVIVVDPRPALERFAHLGDWREHLSQLNDLAQPEHWDLPSQSEAHRILHNYLYHTFARIEEEGKIQYAVDDKGQKLACWHTGLLTPSLEEIFAYFIPHKKRRTRAGYLRQNQWVLACFAPESHRYMNHFSTKPMMPLYFEDASELIYDPRRRLVVDFEHIVNDHRQRFPEPLQAAGSETLMLQLRQAMDRTLLLVQRNYRMALPQYYRGKVQLLLPLCLVDPKVPDLALVVSWEHEVYRANTVLGLDWAYQNARLMAPLEDGWLWRAVQYKKSQTIL